MWWIKWKKDNEWLTLAQCGDNELRWLKQWLYEWGETHPGAVVFVYQIPDTAQDIYHRNRANRYDYHKSIKEPMRGDEYYEW